MGELLAIGALIPLLVLAFLAWVIFTQVMAQRQTSITCPVGQATARRIVLSSLGARWESVPGRGDDNYRPKRGVKAPVLSISYDAPENGGCHVDIWCSYGVKHYGVLRHAQLAWRKKRAVARTLARANLAGSADLPAPFQPTAPPGQRSRGKHSKRAAGAQPSVAEPGLTRTTRPLPILEVTDRGNSDGRNSDGRNRASGPSPNRMRSGSGAIDSHGGGG